MEGEDSPQLSPKTVEDTKEFRHPRLERFERNDSLVTVRLSDPQNSKRNSEVEKKEEELEETQGLDVLSGQHPVTEDTQEEEDEKDEIRSSMSSTVKMSEEDTTLESDATPVVQSKTQESAAEKMEEPPLVNPRHKSGLTLSTANVATQDFVPKPESEGSSRASSRRGSNESKDEGVNWAELQKNEADEPKNEESEESTALLLARLEQENNIIATNPKSAVGRPSSTAIRTRRRAQSRPPSMKQLKDMVNQPTPSLRYSLLPTPPAMTELEFYAALVKDYPKTLWKLPTLVSRKIRGGVPPPLRGVVWQSMAGSRDLALEEQYDRLSGETSPYEGIIGKDLGRSFPGVEMFRDPDGEGQRMLGRVLKCFSLYDQKIGYCQGLGFIVGPLLMHMPDKEAFCILVKLMENYQIKDCFLPDLSGLHIRIYQFHQLLKQHIPNVAAHLDKLQIEPAYVSQWFLSFFAVTCPLHMLFRIFDVLFAEGASETLMRVALSLMRMNEVKITSCSELEDVMQILLSRGIWDCYADADALVNDFVTFSGAITRETLAALEVAYNESRAEVVPEVGSIAARFLGRLFIGSTNSVSAKSTSLAPARPNDLRRSPSKQSLASTLNSNEEGSDSIMSASTDATTVSRDSTSTKTNSVAFVNDNRRTVMSTMSRKDNDLHCQQIEDLLSGLNELHREYAQLETQLQREKEEREEDRVRVAALLRGLTRKSRMEAFQKVEGDVKSPTKIDDPSSSITAEELSSLLDAVEERFPAEKKERRASMSQTKFQLRDELARSKEQLANEISKNQVLSQKIESQEEETTSLREKLRDSHSHIRNAHSEKQRLERQVSEMKLAARNREKAPMSPDGSESSRGNSTHESLAGSGLREFKLGRTGSVKSVMTTYSRRTSSLINPVANMHEANSSISSIASTASSCPPPPHSNIADNESLILELVEAKTAKVMAEQELEEMRLKLDSLRKMMGAKNLNGLGNSPNPSMAQKGHLGRSVSTSSVDTKSSIASSTPTIIATPPSKEASPEHKPVAAGLGGFWSGWGKK